MKKSILFYFLITLIFSLKAQRCLNINVVALMSVLESPGTSASSFKKCNTTKNDHQQTVIADYGTDMNQLDTMLVRTERDFNNAYVASLNPNSQMPSQQDINSQKQLAERLKTMTPDQQRQWAVQQAQEKQKEASARSVPDDGQTVKLIFQTQDIAVNQLKLLNDEFAAKLYTINIDMAKEADDVKPGNKAGCPQDKEGLPGCACANDIDGKYWAKIVSIRDNYDSQKVALLESYVPRIKALVAAVDNNIVSLNYGDAVKSNDLKKTLFSAQSTCFGNAFIVTAGCIKQIRKEGSDAYVNKFNCDNRVYDLSCSGK